MSQVVKTKVGDSGPLYASLKQLWIVICDIAKTCPNSPLLGSSAKLPQLFLTTGPFGKCRFFVMGKYAI